MTRGQLVVHLDQRESSLSVQSGVLHLRDAKGRRQALPLLEIALVVVDGSASTDTHTLRSLADAGIALVAIGGRQRQSAAWVGPGLSNGVRLRHAQHLAYADPARRLRLARLTVAAKLEAQMAVANLTFPDREAPLALRAIATRLPLCTNVAQLMGCEGAAAAAWFADLGGQIPSIWGFSGRARRPPPCPANAMLSYLYAVATSEAHQAVHTSGLDPGIGFVHDIYPGRAAMTLDVVEVARAGVDAIVLALLGSGDLSPADFAASKDGCLMKKSARNVLMRNYANARIDWPGSDGRSLASVLRTHLRRLAGEIDADACREPGAQEPLDDADA
jgi:CRISPR-associated protein Cas1